MGGVGVTKGCSFDNVERWMVVLYLPRNLGSHWVIQL